MDANQERQLEDSLKGLAWWTEPAPGLWRKALTTTPEAPGRGPHALRRLLQSRWPWIAVPVAAVILAAVTLTLNNPDAERSVCAANLRGISPGKTYYETNEFDVGFVMDDINGDGELRAARPAAPTDSPAALHMMDPASPAEIAQADPHASAAHSVTATEAVADGPRHVVRKASIDIEAEDVRGVYLKIISIVPSEAEGEYVEQAQLHGAEPHLSAYVTLRVRSGRLSTVLNTLRGLADVAGERAESTDVTSQVVDLEARLRNERRVEQEMLALLDKREDAPLQELLKVSEAIAQVRERIEKLVAQQQHTARQVALATVVITIRAQDGSPEPTGAVDRFTVQMSSAWSDGVSMLIGSLSAVARVLIGGLLWWIVLVGILVALRRWYVARNASGATPRSSENGR